MVLADSQALMHPWQMKARAKMRMRKALTLTLWKQHKVGSSSEFYHNGFDKDDAVDAMSSLRDRCLRDRRWVMHRLIGDIAHGRPYAIIHRF